MDFLPLPLVLYKNVLRSLNHLNHQTPSKQGFFSMCALGRICVPVLSPQLPHPSPSPVFAAQVYLSRVPLPRLLWTCQGIQPIRVELA
jgi:hypothetical protein